MKTKLKYRNLFIKLGGNKALSESEAIVKYCLPTYFAAKEITASGFYWTQFIYQSKMKFIQAQEVVIVGETTLDNESSSDFVNFWKA